MGGYGVGAEGEVGPTAVRCGRGGFHLLGIVGRRRRRYTCFAGQSCTSSQMTGGLTVPRAGHEPALGVCDICYLLNLNPGRNPSLVAGAAAVAAWVAAHCFAAARTARPIRR